MMPIRCWLGDSYVNVLDGPVSLSKDPVLFGYNRLKLRAVFVPEGGSNIGASGVLGQAAPPP